MKKEKRVMNVNTLALPRTRMFKFKASKKV